jgi:hypothetical protein
MALVFSVCKSKYERFSIHLDRSCATTNLRSDYSIRSRVSQIVGIALALKLQHSTLLTEFRLPGLDSAFAQGVGQQVETERMYV